MITEETINIKSQVRNRPHILSAGYIDATLLGTSDTDNTEQQLTSTPMSVRASHGIVRVLLQLDYTGGDMIDDGKGLVTLFTEIFSDDTFNIHCVHNLKNGISRSVKVQWFAFGYEDYSETT